MLKISADIELNLIGFAREWYSHKGAMYYMNWLNDRLMSIGTKDEPDTIEGYAVHSDGLFFEFALPSPCADAASFKEALYYGRELVLSTVGVNADSITMARSLYSQDGDGTVRLSPDEVAAIEAIGGRMLRQYRTFGCDPDMQVNVERRCGEMRTVPQKVIDSPIREFGGHIHLDLPEAAIKAGRVPEAVWRFQQHLGERGIYYRRVRNHNWYRQPLTYREKPYGIEYRSLPPVWMRSTHSVNQVCEAAKDVLGALS